MQPVHNYLAKLLRLCAENKMPKAGAWHAEVAHDDWCDLIQHSGARCNCDPDIRFIDVLGVPYVPIPEN